MQQTPGFWIFSPQEVESLKRGVGIFISAAFGVLLSVLTPPIPTQIDWRTVIQSAVYAGAFALGKRYIEGRGDAKRAEAVAKGDVSQIKTSDVGAADAAAAIVAGKENPPA